MLTGPHDARIHTIHGVQNATMQNLYEEGLALK
jgi:hypothetical protein